MAERIIGAHPLSEFKTMTLDQRLTFDPPENRSIIDSDEATVLLFAATVFVAVACIKTRNR